MRKKQMVPLNDVLHVVKYVFAGCLSSVADKSMKKSLSFLKKDLINEIEQLKYNDE